MAGTEKPAKQEPEKAAAGKQKPVKKSKKEAPPPPDRRIIVGHGDQPVKYVGNSIRTTKYTLATFLFVNLFEQFRRVANFYFLLIAIFQCIPTVSPTSPVTSILPLVLVLAVTAVKEAVEDLRRWQSDNKLNARPTTRVRADGTEETIPWKSVAVGDILRVKCDEAFPADLVLLSSSLEQGNCYIETTNLDGETNLKTKNSCVGTYQLRSPGELRQIKGAVTAEGPNKDLYHFSGSFEFEQTRVTTACRFSLDTKNVCLRSCSLRNTTFVFGVVVYTGHESKIMKNAAKAPSKRSNLERLLNKLLLILFITLGALVLFCSIANGIWTSSNVERHWYLNLWEGWDLQFLTGWGSGARSALTFIILFNTLIPISLYVTMEVVKMLQAFFINNDCAMYDWRSDTAANARTSNLNEELGQIEYVFSDKTGTLTRNVMEFFKCTIGGVSYGKGISEIRAAQLRRDGNLAARPTGRGFEDPAMEAELQSPSQQSANIRQFFTLLSLCHTCIPEPAQTPQNKRPCPGGRDIMVTYKAASPDEGALVQAAAQAGFYFHTKDATSVTVSLMGQDVKYDVMCVLEFDSDRKRNSVITRCGGRYQIWSKGADTVMIPRLAPGCPFLDATRVQLEGFAAEGLRTLLVGCRDISEAEWLEWAHRYEDAMNKLGNERKQLVDALSEELERGLQLVGATAIEDKLQEGVPETISYLRKAGLKIWVLTGDKQETAINIGFACNLVTPSSQMILIFGDNKGMIARQLNDLVKHFSTIDTSNMDLALVIEGQSLKFCLQDDLKLTLLEFARKCRVVICCRVTPSQKGDVVSLVKENTNSLTLAIGDGANDVNMIQRAHVGVGISGQEGMQAVMSSDYAIAQFRYLLRLLLIHGRWSYYRICKVILYSFYKNLAFCLTLFWFVFFNGFSGQTIFDSFYISTYNAVFTLVPIAIHGLGDQDLHQLNVVKHSAVYVDGQKRVAMNAWLFVLWLLDGVYTSAVIFFFAYWIMDTALPNGQMLDLWTFGNAMYTCAILTVNLKLCFEYNYWTFFHMFFTFGTIMAWFLFALIWSALFFTSGSQSYYAFQRNFVSPVFWLYLLVTPTACLVPTYIIKFLRRQLRPSMVDVLREKISMQTKNELDEEDKLICQYYGTVDWYKSVAPQPLISWPFHWTGFAFSKEDVGAGPSAAPASAAAPSRLGGSAPRPAAAPGLPLVPNAVRAPAIQQAPL